MVHVQLPGDRHQPVRARSVEPRPSVFDIRFEGVIVFDHGDGLLRNDYASHLFYDRREKLWKAYACDFGGTAYTELRSGTGLVTAVSSKDPRRGFQ